MPTVGPCSSNTPLLPISLTSWAEPTLVVLGLGRAVESLSSVAVGGVDFRQRPVDEVGVRGWRDTHRSTCEGQSSGAAKSATEPHPSTPDNREAVIRRPECLELEKGSR